MENTQLISVVLCGVMGLIFFIMAILFTILKEKGAMLVSGFNTLSKEKRELYDKRRISEDQKRQFFLWSGIFVLGSITSLMITPYCGGIALLIWLILFFKEVHLDAEKAFSKYKKTNP